MNISTRRATGIPAPSDHDDGQRLLTTDEAAAYLSVSAAFLNMTRTKYRTTQGPAFVRIGRAIRYAKSDLDEYVAARRIEKPSRPKRGRGS